jgi:hypothetical protein
MLSAMKVGQAGDEDFIENPHDSSLLLLLP